MTRNAETELIQAICALDPRKRLYAFAAILLIGNKPDKRERYDELASGIDGAPTFDEAAEVYRRCR